MTCNEVAVGAPGSVMSDPGWWAVANHEYWDHPRPYPEEMKIISMNDDTARVNALLRQDRARHRPR